MIRGAILGVALISGGATSAMAEIVFVGTVKITAVTPQCQNVDVNDYAHSTFHPKVGTNANFAGFSWIWPHYSRGHALNGRNFDASFRTVVTGGTGWGDPFILPPARQSQLRITSYVPAVTAITAATQTLTLNGQIKRPWDDPGGLNCVMTFIGTYVKDSFE